jgi:hypothetical protein
MAARDASTSRHGWWLLAVCSLAMVLLAAGIWVGLALAAHTGLKFSRTPTTCVVVLSVPAGSDAARAGFRTGDAVDLRLLPPGVRYYVQVSSFSVGDRVTLPLVRDGRTLRLTLTATQHVKPPWHTWLAFAGNFWVLLFAGIIAWRRPQDPQARLLSLFLSTMILGIVLSSVVWQTRWPAADAVVNAFSYAPTCASDALFVAYTMLFARPPSLARRTLAWIAYAACAAAALSGMSEIYADWSCNLDPNASLVGGSLSYLRETAPDIAALACAVAALAATRGAERTRMVWAMTSVGLWYVVTIAHSVVGALRPESASALSAAQNVANLVLPIGLTYSVLNRRLLDVGFAINQAAIFSSVSIIVVGLFMLGESVIGSWFSRVSHVTNLAIGTALVLGLGFSVRAIHNHVERVLDHVFFRKRHENEMAIRSFAESACDATDADALVRETQNALESHADAAFVTLALHDGGERYGDVGARDPAIVALHDRHKALDLGTLSTQLRGEFAYPMIARGQLVGALVLGPKRSGEPYAPDESHAIMQLALAVGAALHILTLARVLEERSLQT